MSADRPILPGYSITERIHRGRTRSVYRAFAEGSSTPLIVKVAGTDPAGAPWAGFDREASLLRELAIEGVPRFVALERGGSQPALVIEDLGGDPLSSVVDSDALGLRERLRVARDLARLLARVHESGVLHGDLNPSNVMVDAASLRVGILDFGLARPIGADQIEDGPEAGAMAGMLEGTPAYVSPEQTGRTAWTVDQRSDLYSLGATFYELFTGRRPFESDDPLRIIHAHIALQPAPPHEIEPSVPPPVSEMILKLLAKSPDARYQTASGLAADFELALRQLTDEGRVRSIEIGKHDLGARLTLPPRLYGRSSELGALHRAFERAERERGELLLVAGYSGVGKTALVLELQKHLAGREGRFVSGKFDQFVRGTPYDAIRQALRELARQILTAPDPVIDRWRERVLAALGSSGQVIIELVPEFERILGPQPAVPVVGPTEAQNRFNRLFREFLQSITDAGTPLVLFLDDVQWIDSASLDLLRVALSGWATPGLLVVAAYRDNEVDEAHPLIATVRELEDSSTSVDTIEVGPLPEPTLAGLVADVLRGGEEHAAPLARIVSEKTGGNPFFVSQFLRSLAEEKLLTPDRDSGRWVYDLGSIERQPSTDNVVSLLLGRIERLPGDARDALRIAACIGNSFDERTLGLAGLGTRDSVARALRPALAEGLIVRAGEATSASTPEGVAEYRFLHDRVQQAAYALIPEGDRPRAHVEIGRSLVRGLKAGEREDRAFELIDQFRRGLALLVDPDEREAVLELARTAGRKARSAAAYGEALTYFEVGVALLPADAWESDYRRAFDLTLNVAEALYLSGRFARGFEVLDGLAEQAASPIDRAEVQILRAAQHETMSDYDLAVEALRRGLLPLGVEFPDRAGFEAALDRELDEAELAVGDRPIRDLIALPPLDDDGVKMAMRLLAFAWAPSYLLADVQMISWIPARMVRLSLEHGNTEESALGYVVHGFTLGTRRGDYRRGREFGLLGIELNEALDDVRLRGKVHELFGCFVNQWRRPLAECIESQRTAFLAGIEGGDFAYGSYGGFVETWYAMLTRPRLEGLEEEYEVVVDFLRSIKNEAFTAAEQVILNWASALRGGTAAPTSLDGSGFSEEAFLAGFGQAPFFRVFHDIIKLHLNLTVGDLDAAVRFAERAAEVVHSVSGTIWPMLLRFYRAMALAARVETGARLDPSLEESLEDDLAQMRLWAENCPENFRHAESLIGAELLRIRGEEREAQDLYRDAIAAARTRGFPGDLGLANERYGRFWLERGQDRIGALFLLEALRAYDTWGAAPKAAQLSRELSAIMGRDAERVHPDGRSLASPAAVLATLQSPSAALDLEWTMKAAGAIASEIETDRLLETLMRTLLESAGAERGGLLMAESGEPVLRVWAEAATGASSLERTPLDEVDRVPVTLVRYVWRTSQEVVLQDASTDPAYAGDAYVRRRTPRSVLCLPVSYQKELLGVVYLENNLDRGAFTRSHLYLLETLSAHAAIALRNAELFEEVAELQERLRAENVQLQEEIRIHHEFEDIVGESPQLMKVLEQVEQVAATDSTVLILGETGTGKELLARAIHRLGPRKDRPLITVNCGAISPGLIESELFGHEKGAFTGATARKFGRFELADKGTILLDEIGDLALDLQVKLLRVLQEGEIERVGGTRTIPVDVRVIAGTHRDLEAATENGAFRPDLYYRLNVFPIRNPPLRERREDIPVLVRYFVMKDGTRLGKRIDTIPKRAMDALTSYDWPGNVRELRNVIERSIITSPGTALELGNWLRAGPTETAVGDGLTLDDVQRAHIERTLQLTGWVVSGPNGAAVKLGLKPTTLEARMKKLGISRPG